MEQMRIQTATCRELNAIKNVMFSCLYPSSTKLRLPDATEHNFFAEWTIESAIGGQGSMTRARARDRDKIKIRFFCYVSMT